MAPGTEDKPVLRFWRKTLTSALEDTHAVAQGQAGNGGSLGQAAPAAACFLPSGLLPNANKAWWERDGDGEEREMLDQVGGLTPATSGLPQGGSSWNLVPCW